MATDSGARNTPAADEVSTCDYQSDTVARSGLVDDLESRIDGEVRFDEYSRQLYATDASLYEVVPIGVVYPRSTADVAAVMSYCAQRDIPVLPRGGGTSLAALAQYVGSYETDRATLSPVQIREAAFL